jgi:PAT family beta-lactamase induction signal transducer AmpG
MSTRLLALLLLGFSSGLPSGLTGSTLQAWMSKEHIDLAVIGLFSLVGVPYSLKFLWAPIMDRYVPPFLGRRRGWLLVTQVALLITIVLFGCSSPREHLGVTAFLALLTAFFSASQDIVVDAYRADILEPEELGPGTATNVLGYRIAMIVSGAVALSLGDHLPWRVVYFIMAAAMSVGIITSLFAPEPKTPQGAPQSIAEAYSQPFFEFFKRSGAIEVVLFTVFYKLDAVLTVALQTVFMLGLGFTGTDIGVVTKGFGVVATILGTLVGGALMVRLGLKRSLWLFGFSQAFAGLSFLALALAGHSYPLMVTAIAVENACSGMGNAAYGGFLLSQCDRRYSAAQYALLSSLMAFTRTVLSAPSGYMAGHLGWPAYYVVCIFASAPAFLLLLRYDRWQNHLAEV